jgi:Ras GTPase-activating-like protein IQGAP2/3
VNSCDIIKLYLTLTQAPSREDTLRLILSELDGAPNLGTEELNDARDRAITLELTNRFAEVEGSANSF